MSYTILVEYRTGNSFNMYDAEDTVPLTWNDKEKARKALRELNEHYQFSKDSFDKGDSNYNPSHQPWFVEEYSTFSLQLENDDGERVRFSVDWCGYFERVEEFRIINADSEEDSIQP